MKKYLGFAMLFVFSLLLPAPGVAGDDYTFDISETEKKPYHFGGYVEFKPLLFGLDQDAAFYKLRFAKDPQGQTLSELNGKVQLEGSYTGDNYLLFAKTNTDLKHSYAGDEERTAFFEAYGSLKPSSSLKIDLGKKTMKWGKGYAWNPVAFVDRPKDPDEPELAQEGFIVATADYIKSLAGPLQTFSFTPLLLPVYNHVNDDFGNVDKLNFAGRFYFLLYDTDIDLLFLTGGSRTDRYGIDFSRNITTNFEVHGEYAFTRNSRKRVLDANGAIRQVEEDSSSYLLGLRYLTSFDLTMIAEYYYNGAGFSGEEMENFFNALDRANNIFQTTGNDAALNNARQLSEGGYGRPNPMQDYLYLRLSQKEPFDILYFTPSLTTIMNLHDRSFSLTPELAYTGITNWDLRLRTGFLVGGRHTEFGEKQNDYRLELRIGYYF